jgi:hypothetical protein
VLARQRPILLVLVLDRTADEHEQGYDYEHEGAIDARSTL